jgi:uncharacterized HAD superfamily protein
MPKTINVTNIKLGIVLVHIVQTDFHGSLSIIIDTFDQIWKNFKIFFLLKDFLYSQKVSSASRRKTRNESIYHVASRLAKTKFYNFTASPKCLFGGEVL